MQAGRVDRPAIARGRTGHPDAAEPAQILLYPSRRRQPNERWQADFSHWWLTDGTHVEILNWLDDHARYAPSVTAHRRVTGPIVLITSRNAGAAQGIPASTLTGIQSV